MKKVLTYLFILANAVITAMVYQLFIFPNNFAPAGIGGICTMIQHLFDINVGYLTLLVNLPLAVAVYFLVNKPMAFRAFVYTIVFSACLVVFRETGIVDAFAFKSDNSAILGPVVGGIIMGGSCAFMLRAGTHQGGTYYISNLVLRFRPDFNFSWVSFTVNALVAFASYFVYGMKLEPVLLCMLYCFVSSLVNDMVIKGGRSAVRFEIVTQYPEELSKTIIQQLHHSATLLPGKGIYQGRETSVLICVVNKPQAAMLKTIVRSYPQTFATVSQVSDVIGNFRQLDNKGHETKHLLDTGEPVE